MTNVPSAIADFWNTQPTNPATPEDVGRIEAAVGAKLPEGYRSFLLSYGYKEFDMSGISTVRARYDMNPDIVEKEVMLQFLFGAGEVIDRLDVFGTPMKHYEDVGARIPPKMLPIGEGAADTNGLILLQLDEVNYGSLWYWERVDETWGTGDNILLGGLGRSLDDMLSKAEEAG